MSFTIDFLNSSNSDSMFLDPRKKSRAHNDKISGAVSILSQEEQVILP